MSFPFAKLTGPQRAVVELVRGRALTTREITAALKAKTPAGVSIPRTVASLVEGGWIYRFQEGMDYKYRARHRAAENPNESADAALERLET